MKKTPVDLQKTFPDIPCVSLMSGGPLLRLGIPRKRWENRWLTGNVRVSTAYWFSILKISRIIQTINFIL